MPTIPLIGAGGVVTSVDPSLVDNDSLTYASDAMIRDGQLMPVGVAVELHSQVFDDDIFTDLAKVSFSLAGNTRTLVSTRFINPGHPSGWPSGCFLLDESGTVLVNFAIAPAYGYRPACVYRDELIYCEAGVDSTSLPIRRYAGAAQTAILASASSTATQGEGVLRKSSGSYTDISPGMFMVRNIARSPATPAPSFPSVFHKVTAVSGGVATVSGVNYAYANDSSTYYHFSVGATYPALRAPSNGSITQSGTTVTGVGTEFTKIQATFGDACIIIARADGVFEHVQGYAASDTSMTGMSSSATYSTGLKYIATAPLSFTDCAVHQASLWGVGYEHDRHYAYVGPPDWDLSFPPGFPTPFDPSAPSESYNSGDFLVDRIPIQTSGPEDYPIAVLPTDGPNYILNTDSVTRIDGVFPSYRQSIAARGIGVMNPEAKVSVERGGLFFAGRLGVYSIEGDSIVDITAGRIDTEYRNIINSMTRPSARLGIAQDTLIVTLEERNATDTDDSVTFHYDTVRGRWMGRVSTPTRGSMWLYPPSDQVLTLGDNGKIGDYASKFEWPRLKGGNVLDAAAPSMVVHTGSALSTPGRPPIDHEALITEIDADVYAYDPGLPSPAGVQFSVVSSGGDDNETATTTVLTPEVTMNPARSDLQRFRAQVNAAGVWHKLVITQLAGTGSSGWRTSVGRVTLGVFNSAGRS